ncbi:cell division cycle 25 homolog d isoform X2 [Electrophorus electricus]|uniref:cell division cycle 25 homolog d isoform X2 n=1 Tax=Electrophorus electricus TaxID=8005 RepID=UPI0015CFB210|nr:cell division cycle 25 homolog d isoform X2 [Electrophorus electricus]
MERSYRNEATWSLSPNSECSPVSELSSCLWRLLRQDSSTPKRRLALTPERGHPPEHETPTVNRWNQSKISSPASSSPKMCHRPGDAEESLDDKENLSARKRVRVRLFSKSSPDDEDEAVSSSKRHHGSPEEGASYHGDLETLDTATLMLFRRLRSRGRSLHTPIPDIAVMDQHLIGDFSKQHVLPVERVEHRDLHCVSSETVAALIRGQFSDVVEDFLIIDCRYPYEYNGGHIKGAVNLYTESQIQQAFLQASAGQVQINEEASSPSSSPSSSSSSSQSLRKLLVFHCEFSSERGPRLAHYLRGLDRALNALLYPVLLYPEVYLLQGGYNSFYTQCPELCVPRGYVHMHHGEFREQLRRFSRKRHPHHRRRPIRTQQRTARF